MLVEGDQRFDTSGFGEVLLALEELRAAIENFQVQPLIVTDPPDLSDIVNAVNGLKPGATAEDIAQAIADRLHFPEPPDNTGAVVEAINALTEKLDWRFQSLGRSFGGGTTVKEVKIDNDVSDRPAREVGNVTVKNPTETGLAKDTTLQQVRDKDFATQLTLASVLTELQRRPVHKVATALTNVASGVTYVTIVAVTPNVPVVIEGYNADFQSLTTAAYRMRLILGTDAAPDIQHAEEVSTTANSWQPVNLNVAANTRIAIQVIHDQITAQDVRATINYYEEP